MKQILKFKIIIFTVILFFFASSVFAAETFFEVKNSAIQSGDQFEVKIFLNTENKSINALEGKITFPEKLLELKEIKDGNSIINFWVERPQAKNGEIIFSGIIPGGYLNNKGLVFSVIFQALQTGSGSIGIQNLKVLLNDGQGTAAKVKISNLQFTISPQTSSAPLTIEATKDTILPEDFKPEIAQNQTMFDGKYFLVFATQDKNSGIDHYEVAEKRKFGLGQWALGRNKIWLNGASPYLLQDQKLQSWIYVKAVDKNGNEKIANLPPPKPLPWYEQPLVYGIIILGLFALTALRKILWRK